MANNLLQAENTDKTSIRSFSIALAGNPNSGKTTLFNAMTGARQHVGNYPGVTVEKIQGVSRLGQRMIDITDLPGTYSLTAYSAEELVARDCIIYDRPDAVIDVIDSSNLVRNLYLAVQIMEIGVPLVLAFNMSDIASSRGVEFDLPRLEKLLGVRIVPTVGHKGTGVSELLSAAVQTTDDVGGAKRREGFNVNYGQEIEGEIAVLRFRIEQAAASPEGMSSRWIAIKLLEGDADVRRKVANADVLAVADEAARRLESLLGDGVEALIAERRYGFISGACQETVRSTVELRRTVSDRIDAIAVNRFLGLPIFLGLMYLVFQLTFTFGEPPMEWIESGFSWLGQETGKLWPEGSDGPLRSLLVDGLIGGVGGVLVFLPNILLLFLAIAMLEDSGYMARAAFLMDRVMHKIGLHGKSFIPMLIGFGCSVPAIMATRTLENQRDRIVTMLVVPLMSCGARLPIYALIIPAFFPDAWHGPMLWIIYLIGIILAIACAKILKMTVLRGQSPPFVMELPPYRMPTVKSVGLHIWNRGGAYLKKAGTVILGISILLWGMQKWPALPDEKTAAFQQMRSDIESRTDCDEESKQEQLAEIGRSEAQASLEASLMGRLGLAMEPVLKPCGFDWKISTAMIGALAAKEVFVSQMGIVQSLGQEQDAESGSLREKLQADYSKLTGFCIMLFCLITAPCMATVAVTRRESNSWGWALFQLAGLTVMAWIVTATVYQLGSFLG